jgi:DNA-binding MarR family transcriptional regulator
MTRDPTPLNADEERFWRAFARAILVTARALESDLEHQSKLSLAEYGILMNLSESAGREMSMSELARQVALSPSHIGRVVGDLASQGLVTRSRGKDDRRVQVASLTQAGLQRLVRAWPEHLRSARNRVVDNIDPDQLQALTVVMERLLAAAEPTDDISR